MPGIAKLTDKELPFGIQTYGWVIQNNQPSSFSSGRFNTLSNYHIDSGNNKPRRTQIYLLVFASILYLFGVQLPTSRFNIPLNNSLQNLILSR